MGKGRESDEENWATGAAESFSFLSFLFLDQLAFLDHSFDQDRGKMKIWLSIQLYFVHSFLMMWV